MNKLPAQILVAYDFSDPSELALQHAVDLGLDDPTREFHFLVVVDPAKGLGLRSDEKVNFEYTQEVQELATQRIENRVKDSNRGGSLTMLVHVRIGDPKKEILRLAEEVGASLILMGSHGRTGVKRMMLGSVSEKVVREALCPVTVARDRGYADVRRSKMMAVVRPDDAPEYVPPHRYRYDSGTPTRSKAWALY